MEIKDGKYLGNFITSHVVRIGVLTSSEAETAFVDSRGIESENFLSKGTEESICGDCDSGGGTGTEDNGDKAAVDGV